MTNARKRLLSVSVGLIAVLGAACSTAPSNGTTAGSKTVDIQLKEYSIAPDVASVPAGNVTMTVHNVGSIEHEMVVLKTDLAMNALPLDGDKVNEEGAGLQAIGEIAEIKPGVTESKTFTMAPGKYIFVCNIAGHYHYGMLTTFEVK